MELDLIKISHLNPLEFRGMTTPEFEQSRKYYQPFSSDDTVKMQVLLAEGLWTSISFDVVDCNGVVVHHGAGSAIPNGFGNYDVWSGSFDCDDLEHGLYTVRLNLNILGTEVTAIYSEIFDLGDHEDTLLIDYSHEFNDFDVLFYPNSQQSRFQLRVEGGVLSEGYELASKDSFYVNQRRQVVMLDSVPYTVNKFTFGPSTGMPIWMADKINRILSLSDVKINNVSYVKNDGAKLEAIREKGYSLAAWQIQLVKKGDDYSHTPLGTGTVDLGDYNEDYNEDYL